MLSSPDWKHPCSAQPPSIPAVPNHEVSLQCPTAKYPCSAQLQSILAVPNCRVSLQCPATKYPCTYRAQPKSIPAVPKRRLSLECPTAKHQYSCSAFAALQGRQLRGAGKRYTSCAITTLGWGCSKYFFCFFSFGECHGPTPYFKDP